MQEYLLESPWIIGLLGFFLAAVLIYAWMQSGRDLFWKSSLGVALATVALLVINVTYKTDREVLDEFIHKIAADLQANRFQEVVKSVHPDASEELRTEQDHGKWFVVDYEHRDPHYEMLNRDGRERLDSLYKR